MKPNKALAFALAGFSLGGGFAAADEPAVGDAAAGQLVAAQCRVCHGMDGVAKIPVAPHIGGEPAAYIVDQLNAFREDAREHEMMNVVAKTLEDDQIADVAAYYAGLRPVVAQAFARPGAAPPENCVGCHGETGISVVEDAPNLAGENEIYIMTQLKAFRTGQRAHEVMSDIAATYSDAELYPAAEWYASFRFSTKPAD